MLEVSKINYKNSILKLLILLVLFISIFFIIYSSIMYNSKNVTIIVEGNEYKITTLKSSINELLISYDIKLNEEYVMNYEISSKIDDGMLIEINKIDEIVDFDIKEDFENIYFKNIVFEKELVQEEIEYNTINKNNSTMEVGQIKVLQDGENGLKQISYLNVIEDGVKKDRLKTNEEIIKEPMNKVVEKGVKLVSRSSYQRTSLNTAGFKSYNIPLSLELQKYTYTMAKKYGVSYELMLALMKKESGFGIRKVSATNDYGLCQINKSNFSSLKRKLKIDDFFDPYQNIEAGAYMLSSSFNAWRGSIDSNLLEKYALNSYNMGVIDFKNYINKGGNVDRDYSSSVLGYKATLISTGGL